HNGEGAQPGLKDDFGNWNLDPHLRRVSVVDSTVLQTWHALLEDEGVPVIRARMVYTVNEASAAVLARFAQVSRVSALSPHFSFGWHETGARSSWRFDLAWGRVESWKHAILQGPNFHVAVPFSKFPNETMLHNQDWVDVDLEELEPDA